MFGFGCTVNGKEKWVPDANQEMEFYCDMWDKTIPNGQVTACISTVLSTPLIQSPLMVW